MADASVLDTPQAINTLPMNKWLVRVRTLWFALIGVLFISFLLSIPSTYQMLKTVCDKSIELCDSWSQPTPQTLEALAEYQIPLQTFATYNIILFVTVSLVFWGAGFLVLRYRSRDWHGLLVSYLLITLASGGVSFVFLSGQESDGLQIIIQSIGGITTFPTYLALSLFFQSFPDGKIYPQWARLGTLLILANYGAWVVPNSLNIEHWSPLFVGLWLLLVYGFHVVIQGYRYKYYYSPAQRQQTKWLILGAGIALISAIMFTAFGDPAMGELLESALTAFGFYLPIGIAITVAILRYRLWDIDIIINRTLVYVVLTSIVVAIYVGSVGVLSEIFRSNDNLIISLITTGFVAIIFQPLREQIQRAVNRYVFGERNNPYEVISRLSERLEHNVSPKTLLPGIAEMIAQTLKLSYVAITLKDHDKFRTDAVYGQPVDQGRITILDLPYGQDIIGQLIIGQDAGDKQLNVSEHRLLENIARQTGVAAHAVQLSTALQFSRQQIVVAREEERRRLRRDLHDGLGPSLASHTIKIGAARALIETNPQTATQILDELEVNLADSLTDIRRLVYNLRPPALDQLGLIGAIRDFVQQCNGGTSFTFYAPEHLPMLQAAVEVATYRITQEAVNNVIRHASATHCTVELQVNGMLEMRIQDDGVGLPTNLIYGVGMNSMRERVEELDGEFILSSRPHQGTYVNVRIPL